MMTELEERLSEPTPPDVEWARRLRGDLLLLGAGGKMGPSLARLARRAIDAAGTKCQVIAVSRFSSGRSLLDDSGIETIACDLLDRDQVDRLPECPNVVYLAGRKFGSVDRPDLTWAANCVAPANVAQRFRQSRIVVFSTGNVYPLVSPDGSGCLESEPPMPVGEYAQSCLARERIFEYYSRLNGTPCLLFRLNYAVDLRYGVLVDIARNVHAGEPVNARVPALNAIWQRDANSYALRSLDLCASPPRVLNVTGPETIFVRQAAEWFAARFGRHACFAGEAGAVALVSNASACHAALGLPQVPLDTLMEWVAEWVEGGGESLNRATHFEVADGRY